MKKSNQPKTKKKPAFNRVLGLFKLPSTDGSNQAPSTVTSNQASSTYGQASSSAQSLLYQPSAQSMLYPSTVTSMLYRPTAPSIQDLSTSASSIQDLSTSAQKSKLKQIANKNLKRKAEEESGKQTSKKPKQEVIEIKKLKDTTAHHKAKAVNQVGGFFHCPKTDCNAKFKENSKLAVHFLTHTKEFRYKCGYEGCNTVGNNITLISNHMEKAHKEGKSKVKKVLENGNEEVIQLKKIQDTQARKKAQKINEVGGYFYCPESGCDKKYTTKDSLVHHLLTHTQEFLYKCGYEICNYQSNNTHKITRHIKSIHEAGKPVINVKEQLERRAIRQETTAYQETKDLKRDEISGLYVCPQLGCGYSHKIKANVTDHTDISCNNITDLRTHENRHEGVKKYKCELCPKCFVTNSDLHQHMLKHSEVRNYECEECNAKFKTCKHLKNHIAYRHSDKRPFLCEIKGCSYSAKTRTSIINHYTHRHKLGTPYQCEINNCEYVAYSQYRFDDHMFNIHRNSARKEAIISRFGILRSHACSYCGKLTFKGVWKIEHEFTCKKRPLITFINTDSSKSINLKKISADSAESDSDWDLSDAKSSDSDLSDAESSFSKGLFTIKLQAKDTSYRYMLQNSITNLCRGYFGLFKRLFSMFH